MDPAVVAVFTVSKIYNISMDHGSFFIVNTDAERIFFYNYFQFFSLDHGLICSIFQNSVSGLDFFTVVL